MRKTKIVATLGPATDSEEILRGLLDAGMDVARFNFSHGDYEEQAARLALARAVAVEKGIPLAMLADTKGPEVRLGVFEEGRVTLTEGQKFSLVTVDCKGDAAHVSVSYAELPRDVTRGSHILLDDGLIELAVDSVSDTEIVTTVLNGGVISSRKGVNIPGAQLSMPFLSSRDRADLRFVVEQRFDFIAASFTRCAEDIKDLREELTRLDGDYIRVIAKIENAQGVANIEEILAAADGIMVARGDMGVEIPLEELPIIQKELIKKCYRMGKQVITATQMLDSMMKNPRPTRAETCDVANAIYDGTSAIMLSGETAAGKYPVEAVKTMARIALRTERDIDYKKRFRNREPDEHQNITSAISHATCTTAHDLGAAAIITVTQSGVTARGISKYRPAVPIICCSPLPHVQRQMNMSWGVSSLLTTEQKSSDELFAQAVEVSQKAGLIQDGDLVVLTAGLPLGKTGTTNMLRVHVVGDPIRV